MLVQKYISKSNDAEIHVFVEDTKGAKKKQAKEGEFRSNLHIGGKATIVELTKKERETSIKAASKLGLGIAGEYILQSKEGHWLLKQIYLHNKKE